MCPGTVGRVTRTQPRGPTGTARSPLGAGLRPVRRSHHEPEPSVWAPEGRLSPGQGWGRRAAQREPGLPAHGLRAGRRRLLAVTTASLRLLPLLVSAGATGGRGAGCAPGRRVLAGAYDPHPCASEHACSPGGRASLGWDPPRTEGRVRISVAPGEQPRGRLPATVRPRALNTAKGDGGSCPCLLSGCYPAPS